MINIISIIIILGKMRFLEFTLLKNTISKYFLWIFPVKISDIILTGFQIDLYPNSLKQEMQNCTIY